MDTELGVVSGVGFGMRDMREPGLWFTISTLRGSALAVFHGEEAIRVIKEAQCYDVQQLDGKACIVNEDDHSTRFVSWFKP